LAEHLLRTFLIICSIILNLIIKTKKMDRVQLVASNEDYVV